MQLTQSSDLVWGMWWCQSGSRNSIYHYRLNQHHHVGVAKATCIFIVWGETAWRNWQISIMQWVSIDSNIIPSFRNLDSLQLNSAVISPGSGALWSDVTHWQANLDNVEGGRLKLQNTTEGTIEMHTHTLYIYIYIYLEKTNIRC